MRSGLWSGAAIVALASASSAAAQEVPHDLPTTETNNSFDIVVTAQRRSESLQRVAAPISAVSSDTLARANVAAPEDLTKLTPSLNVGTGGGSGTVVTIRGVGGFSGNAFGEPGVAVSVDGVYIARSAGPNGLFYDLDRVEILKGPQGTLYGRNATAGALNIITRAPQSGNSVSGSLSYGNYNAVVAQAAINLSPSDKWAFRLSGTLTRHDGYLSDGYNDDDTRAVRGQILFTPSNAVSIRLVGDYARVDARGNTSVTRDVPGLPNPPKFTGPSEDATNTLLRNASLGITSAPGFPGGPNPNYLPQIKTDGFVDIESYGAALHVDIDLGGADLTLLPAYRGLKNQYLHYSPGFPLTADESSDVTTMEARLSSKKDSRPVSWLIGGYYFNEDSNFDLLANQGVAFNRTIPVLTTRALAGFGQLTFRVSEQIRLVGGARYSHERKTQTGLTGGPPPPITATPPGFPGGYAAFLNVACNPYQSSTGTCFQPLDSRLSQGKLTWKAGIEFDAAPSSLIYANAATGFKAGGFFGSQPPNTYKPETLTAYTVGTRNTFADGRIQLNAELFYWQYRNRQVTHLGPVRPSGFDLITENAAAADLYGFDIEFSARLSRHDRFTANVQYNHSRYKNFRFSQTIVLGPPTTSCATAPIASDPTAVTVDCSGRPLAFAPQWVANLSYVHTFELADGGRIEAQAGTQLSSAYWTSTEYLPGERQSSFSYSNASLTWHLPDDRFSIGAFIDNIENGEIKTVGFVQPVLGLPNSSIRPPRIYGIKMGFNL